MSNSNFLEVLKIEINTFFTFCMLKLLDHLSWCSIASIIRANVLRAIGFKIGKNVKIMTGINITKISKNLYIGDDTFINKNVYIDVNSPISIGKCCDIGFNTVLSNNNHSLKSNFRTRRPGISSNPIMIKDFVWIGCNVIILGGVTIGEGAVVGAGSIVTQDVPSNTVVAGNPARIIKKIS